MSHILQTPKDSWVKMVKKIAGDVNHRIFQALPKEGQEFETKPLDKETFLHCFLSGESTSQWGGKAIKNLKVGLGRELKVKTDGEEKTFMSAHIFENPTSLWEQQPGQYYTKKSTEATGKYLFRHAFEFERNDCQHLISLDEPSLQKFATVDKFDRLQKIKHNVVKEITRKFLASDVKIVNAITEVLNENFINTNEQLHGLKDRFDVFILNQNQNHQAIMKNQDQNQKNLLEAMKEIKKKIENPLNHDHVTEIQTELEATKTLMEAKEKEVEATRKHLEEEKYLRRQSKLRRIAQTEENISTEPGNT